MQIGLAREGLSKHLHNSITYILGVKNKEEQMMPPPNDDPPSGSKMIIIASHGDGHKSAKDYISKVNLDAQSDNKQFIEDTIEVCELRYNRRCNSSYPLRHLLYFTLIVCLFCYFFQDLHPPLHDYEGQKYPMTNRVKSI